MNQENNSQEAMILGRSRLGQCILKIPSKEAIGSCKTKGARVSEEEAVDQEEPKDQGLEVNKELT